MKIAIDIDETIMNNSSLIYRLMNRLALGSSKKKLHLKKISPDSFDDLNVGVLNKVSKLHNVDAWVEVDNCSEIIRDWFNQGVEIILLSSRPSTKALNKVLLKWLELKAVPYSMIVLACNNKAEYCRQNQVDVLVDNSMKNCKKSREMGIFSIFLNKKKPITNMVNASNWNKVAELFAEFASKHMSASHILSETSSFEID